MLRFAFVLESDWMVIICDIGIELGICGSRLICRFVCVCMNWDWLCVIGLAEWS